MDLNNKTNTLSISNKLLDSARDDQGHLYLLTKHEIILVHDTEDFVFRTWTSSQRRLEFIKIHFSPAAKCLLIAHKFNSVIIFDPTTANVDKMKSFELDSRVFTIFETDKIYFLCEDHSIWHIGTDFDGKPTESCPKEDKGHILSAHSLCDVIGVVYKTNQELFIVDLVNIASGETVSVNNQVYLAGVKDIRLIHGVSALPAVMVHYDDMRVSILHIDSTGEVSVEPLGRTHPVMAISVQSISNQFALIVKDSETNEQYLSVWDERFRSSVSHQRLGCVLSGTTLKIDLFLDFVCILDKCFVHRMISPSFSNLKLSDMISRPSVFDSSSRLFVEYISSITNRMLTEDEKTQLYALGEDSIAYLLAQYIRNTPTCTPNDYFLNLVCSIPYSSCQLVPNLKRYLPLDDAMILLRHFVGIIAESNDLENLLKVVDWVTLLTDAYIVQLRETEEYSELLGQLKSLVDSHLSMHRSIIQLEHIEEQIVHSTRQPKSGFYRFEIIKFQ